MSSGSVGYLEKVRERLALRHRPQQDAVRPNDKRVDRTDFDAAAGPQWAATWQEHNRNPHAALEAAIDSAHLPVFMEELAIYKTGER